MTCSLENLHSCPEKGIIPETQTHVDQKLVTLINLAIDNCDHQISLDRTGLTTINDRKIFSNYLDLLHSAINNPIPATEGQNAYLTPQGCLDSWNDIYRAVFLPESEKNTHLSADPLQSRKECSLIISRINGSTFDIKYSLIDREFRSVPQNDNTIGTFIDPKNIPTRKHLIEKSPIISSRYKKLADVNIKISGGSDPSVSLKLYSVDSKSFCSKCFQSPVPIVLNENAEAICGDVCQYLSTFNLSSPLNLETKLITPKLP